MACAKAGGAAHTLGVLPCGVEILAPFVCRLRLLLDGVGRGLLGTRGSWQGLDVKLPEDPEGGGWGVSMEGGAC